MKKAKLALTIVSILSVIGSSLAFKVTRGYNTFYSLGTTLVGGQQLTGCIVEHSLPLLPVTFTIPGAFLTAYSTTTHYPTNTCTAFVIVYS